MIPPARRTSSRNCSTMLRLITTRQCLSISTVLVPAVRLRMRARVRKSVRARALESERERARGTRRR